MKVESHDTVKFCKHCHSDRIRKEGVRRNKSGDVQLIKCSACGKRFSANFGFRYRRHSPAIVSEALHLFYSGMSTRGLGRAGGARHQGVGLGNLQVGSALFQDRGTVHR